MRDLPGLWALEVRLIERFLDWYLIVEDDEARRSPVAGLINGVRLGVLVWLAILGPIALAKLFWSTS